MSEFEYPKKRQDYVKVSVFKGAERRGMEMNGNVGGPKQTRQEISRGSKVESESTQDDKSTPQGNSHPADVLQCMKQTEKGESGHRLAQDDR